MNYYLKRLTLTAILSLFACSAFADGGDRPVKIPNYSPDVQKEKLGRGLTAIHNGDGRVSISWRYLETDPIDIAFNLFRQTGRGKAVQINSEPLTASTFFVDSGVDTKKNNKYILTLAGPDRVVAEYELTVKRASTPWLSIPMAQVPGDTDWRYAPNDASVGDLTGDGEYEIVIKRENGGFDNSHRGVSPGTTLLEAYKLDGTFMWRVDLGVNIQQGAHYTQFMVYDFDGDGKAEIAVRTAEGTVFGDGTVIGDTDGDGITDYVDRDPESPTYGKILAGPEFLSVIDGETGRELARAPFISRGEPFEFGDNKGNRVDRFLGGAGYFDGARPSILICRGYYAKTVLEAWDYRDGKLTKRWTFDTDANNGLYKAYEGQGNHSLAVADVNGDGKDEITYGAMLVNSDGTGGYNTRLGHGDAMHLTDIDIDRPGLEVWDSHEHMPSRAGSEMRDARTGELLWGIPSVEDVGRAMAADIDPRFRGLEVWTTHSGGVYTADGKLITDRTPSINMAVWWTGDLNRELLNGSGVPRREWLGISKWTGDGVVEIPLPGQDDLAANNHTKGNPCLSADILGDWREEVIARTKDNKEVRIYMTDYPTDYRFHTLMSDIPYRWTALIQNVAYNQPTQPGFYLGSDLGKFFPSRFVRDPDAPAPVQEPRQRPEPRMSREQMDSLRTADSVRYHDYIQEQMNRRNEERRNRRPNGMNSRLEHHIEVVNKNIKTDKAEYVFDARYDYDSYRWTVNGTEVPAGRHLTLRRSEYGLDRPVEITLRVTYKGCVFEDSGTVTFIEAIPRIP